MITTQMRTDVSQLYVALFGRAPDGEGLGYWVQQRDAGQSMTQIANTMYATTPARAYFPSFMTNGEIIASFYVNVLGRTADTEGLAFWTAKLNASGATPGSVIAEMINVVAHYTGTDPAGLTSQALYNNKVAVAQWYGEQNGAIAGATTILAGVTADPATVTAAMSGSVTSGQTLNLTTDADTVEITTANTVDIVKGYWEGTAGSDTFSVADAINGNGQTELRLVVAGNGAAPYVEMSGIDKLSIIAADSVSFDMNASTYGSAVSEIALSGADFFDLDVMNLSVEGSLELSVAASTDGDIYASGTADGVGISATLYNDDADGVGAVASIGSAGLNATLGESDTAWLYYYQTASKAAAAVSVGDLTVAGVDLVLGKSASATLTISNTAHNTGTGSATVGNVTIGDINVAAGLNASLSMTVYNSATADNGAAKVGNITVGDIAWTGAGSGASGSIEFYNNAQSTKGNATAGDITIGNITVASGSSSSSVSVSASNYADATTSGNAKVGNITVGDLTFTAGDNFDSPDFSFENQAYADNGTATAGNITFGNVSLVGGNDGGEIELTVSNYAEVTTAGAATVGSVTVGDIDMVVGTSSTANVSISNEAYTAKGAATVGAVTVGDVTGTAGLNGTLDVWISAQANGTAGDSVGAVTIGNIDLYGEPNANLNFEVSVSANAGSVSKVSIGNIDMTVDGDGSLSFEMDVFAQTNIGDIVVGDVTLTLGTDASIDTFSIYASASTGDIASFTIGDVTIIGAAGAYDGSQGFTIAAGDDLGAVTIGDVTVTAGVGGSFTSMTWDFSAGTGNIGNVVMGDTTLTAAATADNWRYVNFTADGEIGSVTVGDVSLTDAKSGSVWLSHDYFASDDIGNVVYGDISAVASGRQADAGFSFEMDANGNTIGTVTFGDVNLTAAGDGAWAGASIWLSDTGDAVGLATVGDITLNGSNTKAATQGADVGFTMDSNGSITVGDITVAAGAAAATFANAATVDFYVDIVTGNNLTVGNIMVTGGSINSNTVSMDNLADLTTWLALSETGSGSITIGNVDYSGYNAAATINVSGFKGAAVITAAQDDTFITLNTTKNVVNLDSGSDTVDVLTGGTLKATVDVIDVINSFTSGSDLIRIDTSAGQTDFAYVSSASADYAAFLASAGSAMSIDGTDFYARKVGADLYLAVDQDNGGAVDFVIKLAGISTITATDILAY